MRWLDGITNSMDMSLTPGVSDRQGGQVCCSPWGCKELDMTEQLNNHSKNLPEGTQLLSSRVHIGTQTIQL